MGLIEFRGVALENFVPDIQEAYKLFAVKNKHKLVIPCNHLGVIHADIKLSNMIFLDPKAESVGASPQIALLRYENEAGRNKTGAYVLESRLIENFKYAPRNRKHRTLVTNDVRKIVSYMHKYVLPVTSKEIAIKNKDIMTTFYDNWRSELYWESVRGVEIGRDDIMQEIDRLNSLGVSFITEGFKKAIKAMPNWKEHKRRQNLKVSTRYVILHGDKASLVVNYKGADGTPQVAEKDYDSHEQLPETIYQKLSLLKMLEDGGGIPEVGVRVNANQYWIFEEASSA